MLWLEIDLYRRRVVYNVNKCLKRKKSDITKRNLPPPLSIKVQSIENDLEIKYSAFVGCQPNSVFPRKRGMCRKRCRAKIEAESL